MSRYQFPAQATTDASLLVSGTLADARLSSNVALENVANVFTAKQSFSGTTHVGLCLNSLTTAEYTALTATNGDLFRDSTTDRIDARLNRGTVELVDTAGGQTINGALTLSGLLDLRKAATANILQFSNDTFLRTDTSQLSIFSTSLARSNIALWRGGNFVVGSSTLIAASSGVDATGNVVDTSLSRNAAGVWQMGTTAANASGSLLLTNLTASGTVLTTGQVRGASVWFGGISQANTKLYGSASGQLFIYNSAESAGVMIDVNSNSAVFRNLANNADAPITCSNLTASGSVFAAGSPNVYSFSSTHPVSAAPSTSWRFGSGWSGNYDTQFIFAYADNAAKVLIDTAGAITAFGGYYVNVPASSSNNIRPLQHGNSFLRFSAPASGIPGNNITVEGWDSVLLNASTGNVRLRIGGADRLVLTNTDLTLTGNLTASGTVRLGTFTVGTLPSAAANTRALAYVTDSSVASFGAVATAGGALGVTVFSNGTNWIVSGGTTQPQKAITSGTAAPSGGVDGDIYLQYV